MWICTHSASIVKSVSTDSKIAGLNLSMLLFPPQLSLDGACFSHPSYDNYEANAESRHLSRCLFPYQLYPADSSEFWRSPIALSLSPGLGTTHRTCARCSHVQNGGDSGSVGPPARRQLRKAGWPEQIGRKASPNYINISRPHFSMKLSLLISPCQGREDIGCVWVQS